MAKILYKAGHEGQNKIECIEGIEIDLFNGQKALIYPKYARRALLKEDKIKKWEAPKMSEIEALTVENTIPLTEQLISLESPAAEWVNQFYSEKNGTYFVLPSFLAAMEIQRQKKEIDALAKTIKGADLLQNYIDCVWSCSRFLTNDGWCSYGCGFGGGDSLNYPIITVPVILYR